MYSDQSLREFFHTIQHMPWYKNTLFVITADHTSEGYYPYYQTDIGQYAIPLLFFQPGDELKGRSTLVAQQTDILPSVIDYLGYDKPYVAYGSSLFDTTAPHFSVHFISGLYGLIKDDHYIEFDGDRVTSLYDLRGDPLLKNNLVTSDKVTRDKASEFLKAYIQQYNNRIIENRLTLDQ